MSSLTDVRRGLVALFVCALSTYSLLFAQQRSELHAQESVSLNIVAAAPGNALPKRLALVIGNGAYRNVPTLKNTKGDATAMAAKLQKLGYDVLYRTDLDRRNMNETISMFLARIEPGSEALVYYSGHGVELNGSNYLLPIDIPALSPDQERMLRTEGANLTDLLLDLEARSARVSLVILDACRDNPFRETGGGVATRSLGATRGLGRVDPPRGTFVIFSAGVGEQAIDNLGSEDTNPNGLFTRKLLTLIDQDGLEIRPMVQRLRAEVRQAALSVTGRSQIPSYYDQLLGEFYFQPKSQQTDALGENSCDRLVDANASAVSLLKADLNAGLQACEAASTQYPNEVRFVRQLQAVQEQRMAQRAIGSNQIDFANVYLLLYPNGRFVSEIKTHVATLGEVLGFKPAQDQPSKLPVPVPPAPAVVPQVDVGRVLETELKRVGCDPVSVDGKWGRSSTVAMATYNRITNMNFDTNRPTLEAVEALRAQSARVCPLVCKIGERAESNECVPKTCKPGTKLGSSVQCEPFKIESKPKPGRIEVNIIHEKLKKLEKKIVKNTNHPPKPVTHAQIVRTTRSRASNCFMFNGVQQCE